MSNWDLYILFPITIIVALSTFALIVKKRNVEKKWILFFIQVLLTTTSSMIVVESNLYQVKQISSSSSTIAIIMALFASWFLFAAIFKVVYAVISIKLVNRKIIFQVSNIFLIFAILLSFLSISNMGFSIFVLILQSFLIGATLGAQSIYFLFLNEQRYNKVFPLRTAFTLGSVIVFSGFLAFWFVGLNNLAINDKVDIDKILSLFFAIIALILALLIFENKSKIGAFSPRILYQLSPYNSKILIKMAVLTLIVGIIYSMMQSPIFKLYLVAAGRIGGHSDSYLEVIDRHYTIIFLFAQFFVGYVFFRLFAHKLNVNYIFIIMITLTGLTLLLNSFVINSILLWISDFIYGSLFFMMYYFWFGFAIMWNSRAIRKPVTGWITGALLFSQFLVTAFFNIFIYTSNNYFPLKTINEVINANISDVYVAISKLEDVMKITTAIAFAINCLYAILSFLWTSQIISEYQNWASITKKMYEIEKADVENRVNSRMVLE